MPCMDVWPRLVPLWLGIGLCSAALGFGIVANLQVAFIALVALFGIAALAAPASSWVIGAVIAAVGFRGLVQLNVLPAVATFIDLPLAWGALGVALLKQRKRSPLLAGHMARLGVLAIAVVLAAIFNHSQLLRPVLYLALLGEPFAVMGALLAEPPTAGQRRALRRTLFALLMIQVPVCLFQFAAIGPGDPVQGTLYGAGAGAHVISAVIVVGAIWILSGGVRLPPLMRHPIPGVMLTIPFLADAKQVILASPAIILATDWQGGLSKFVLRAALAIGAVVALFTVIPAGSVTAKFIEEAQSGQGGKQETASLVWQKLQADPGSLAFGLGPAETVSRAAYLTTGEGSRAGSPLASLGLTPATIPAEAEVAALQVSRGGTSFNHGTSSALGVLGDLGVFGLMAYMALVFSTFLRLRKAPSPEGIAAASGFALFLVLGVVLDWWEQPPFGVVLGALGGLALTRSITESEAVATPKAFNRPRPRSVSWRPG
jgi:hypothetical protein